MRAKTKRDRKAYKIGFRVSSAQYMKYHHMSLRARRTLADWMRLVLDEEVAAFGTARERRKQAVI